MKLRTYLFPIFIFTFTTSLTKAKNRHRHQRKSAVDPQNFPQLTVDARGNCHVIQKQLRGRCVRIHDCPSAIKEFQQTKVQAISCYNTTYENFVCCQDPNIVKPPKNYTEPLLMKLKSSQQQPHLTVQTTAAAPVERRRKRINEIKCGKFYMNGHHHKKRQRSNRNALDNSITEIIKRVNISKNLTVSGVKTQPHEFSYMCVLGWESKKNSGKYVYNCGCVLIAKKYALTAAHCAWIRDEQPTIVRLGATDLNAAFSGETRIIRKFIQHPNYSFDKVYNDIAIVKFQRKTSFKPACIWNAAVIPEKQQLLAIGYGDTKFSGSAKNTLLKVPLQPVGHSNCSQFYKTEDRLDSGLGEGHLCANDPTDKMDICQKNAGGPLIIQYPKHNNNSKTNNNNNNNKKIPYVVGLTPFSVGCVSGMPSVFTRISHFVDWIEDTIWH